mmetsp:Transcript_22170/g.51478  ORF Transcript_22170/g.51478 Transcript_22170/m.51478 type:complete len:219 (+) Transcript_22170:80-736(+)
MRQRGSCWVQPSCVSSSLSLSLHSQQSSSAVSSTTFTTRMPQTRLGGTFGSIVSLFLASTASLVLLRVPTPPSSLSRARKWPPAPAASSSTLCFVKICHSSTRSSRILWSTPSAVTFKLSFAALARTSSMASTASSMSFSAYPSCSSSLGSSHSSCFPSLQSVSSSSMFSATSQTSLPPIAATASGGQERTCGKACLGCALFGLLLLRMLKWRTTGLV